MTSTDPQVRRLLDLGVHELAGITADAFGTLAGPAPSGAVLVVHPDLVGPAALTPLLERAGKPGFVVEDMTDLDQFTSVIQTPDSPLYWLLEAQRGDDLRNHSPEEALGSITSAGRTPLTISEGIGWALQHPEIIEPNHCFMCIGSRKPKGTSGYDARTPALWISGGTGRDGRERKDAPKVGWCWWRNRHTWLGIGSAGGRV